MPISRFGVSLPQDLLDKFDRLIRKQNYSNRSEAFRDLIRRELVKKEWQQGKEIAGAVTLIYDHHQRELLNKITDIQHGFQKVIVSTQHLHLDCHNCLEIIAIKGNPRQAHKLTDALKSTKGIKHVTLSMSTTGRSLGG